MSHLGAFAAEKVAPLQAFDARIAGVWEGTTSKALGGYRQRIEFHNDAGRSNEEKFRAQIDRQIDGWMDGSIDTSIDKLIDKSADKSMDKWIDKWIDKSIDGWMDV